MSILNRIMKRLCKEGLAVAPKNLKTRNAAAPVQVPTKPRPSTVPAPKRPAAPEPFKPPRPKQDPTPKN